MLLGNVRFRKHLIWLLLAVGAVAGIVVFAPGLAELRNFDESPIPLESLDLADLEPSGSFGNGAEPVQYAALEPSPSATQPMELAAHERTNDPLPNWAGEGDASMLPCIIEPNRIVPIGSPVTGLIDDIPVERADFIEKGQILVQLDAKVEKASVALARSRAEMDEDVLAGKARLELGNRKRSRVNKLFKENALSLDLREEAETEAELARLEFYEARAEKQLASLELDRAQAMLERRTIHSPFAGVVMERLMSPGQRVDQETILKIAQIDPLRVEVILPSAMFGTIERGARTTVIPEIPGDTMHVAIVAIVDRVVDSASGTFGVQLELPNPDHAIPGGVHCQVRFAEK